MYTLSRSYTVREYGKDISMDEQGKDISTYTEWCTCLSQ